ncbi:hypothetical protein [Pseudonocardia cypriaca]|uniref:Uncharacterized protein n=1 Tax=Pseudonocardia cypriaca TaxID=882449 RepID=A0A543GAG3_9PSEU|nr:hypothetical protein [Pseudonocardia cypriaca]TQM43062.1 hypothetical protein FB388_0403 [Pseudonocardia cypriaca]
MGEEPVPASAEGFSRLWKIVGQLVAPTTLVTVLLIYFGWVRTSVIYEVFGISYSTLGLTVDDLLFRSVSTTFTPVALVLLLMVVVRPAHILTVRLLRTNSFTERLVPLLVSIGGALATAIGLLGFTRVVQYSVEWPLVPIGLGLGLLLLSYGAALRGTTRSEVAAEPASRSGAADAEVGSAGGSRTPVPNGHDLLQRVALAAVVLLSAFWALAVFAQLNGISAAEQIARQPRSLPGVVIYASNRLHLSGPGILESPLHSDAEATYRFRYDGYRLLLRSNEKYFLLPLRWRPGARAVVLADDASLRVEFFR